VIVDAHQHFWDAERNPYPWLTTAPHAEFRYGDYSALRRRYLPDDFRRDAARQEVVATVHVEAEWDPTDEVAETRWLAGLRAGSGLPTVAVGHARLERDDVADVLASHAKFVFVRGIRQKPAPGQMLDARWRRGFALLERHHLTFDLQSPFAQMPEAADLARAFPRTTIIVNHTGLPADRSAPGLTAWRRALESVAAEPNVVIKISGLGQRDKTWPEASNRLVVRDTIAIFGAGRCMFASNFPVDGLCAGYDTIVDGFKAAIADRPAAEQSALLHDNAVRIYRIRPQAAPQLAG
jgi:predicted TIM-barrel fold metal-dependent hydrolase